MATIISEVPTFQTTLGTPRHHAMLTVWWKTRSCSKQLLVVECVIYKAHQWHWILLRGGGGRFKFSSGRQKRGIFGNITFLDSIQRGTICAILFPNITDSPVNLAKESLSGRTKISSPLRPRFLIPLGEKLQKTWFSGHNSLLIAYIHKKLWTKLTRHPNFYKTSSS